MSVKPGEPQCIQGFVIGAVATLAIGGVALRLPLGRVFDATAPGLLFAMSIGRVGCFLGGCCAGRPTASRWGLWSSDRRLGVRRIPTQLLESGLAFAVGLAALWLEWNVSARVEGAVFVAVIAVYTIGRQLIFPLRDLPRHTSNGRIVTMVAAGAVATAAMAGVLA